MRHRIIDKVDIKVYLKEQSRRHRVYGQLVSTIQRECDLSWTEAKEQVNKNLKQQTLWHLLRNC